MIFDIFVLKAFKKFFDEPQEKRKLKIQVNLVWD